MNYKKIFRLSSTNVKNKTVLLRLDLNVPVIDKKITSTKRIDESLQTINYLLDQNAKVVILSHFGRIKSINDIKSGKFSLLPVARELANKLANSNVNKIKFITDNKGQIVEEEIRNMESRDIIILENTRYNDISREGELINLESGCDNELSQYWSSLCDVYCNDAFGAAHRKHASTFGIGSFTKKSCIGFLMDKELNTLTRVIEKPKKPLLVIFGGAKVSDKLKAVESIIGVADKVIISGGMAYTFAAAKGFDVGLSLVEKDMIPVAQELMEKYGDKLCISSDFMCSPKFADLKPQYRTQEEGLKGLMGLDIGQKSIDEFVEQINDSYTILWNGPMGVTEFDNYTKGTNEICKSIAERTNAGAFTVIGGGDSAAAAEKLGMENSFSFISTGGGASLALIEGRDLEGISSIALTSFFHKKQ